VTGGNGQAPKLVRLSIDGTDISVPEGTLIIRAAEALGIEIPRFCDHPLLDPVGACRQCIVEVEGQKKPLTSCTTPVAEGMEVRTQHTSDMARESQEGMLEFLLINHPLDCPVCDRGGECPLQDQALAWGPGESRYIDPKRVYRKPIALSPLVALDRERCVLCARCTRFCDQVSGERFIELFDRGPAEQVAIAAGEDFRSPFSGNTVQICPVGALTSSTYRFAARPFDVRSQDTVCPHCASGCNIRVDVRRGEVVRHLARDNYEVNDAWLCDKGRYAFRFPDRDRATMPLLRVPGLEPVSYREVFEAIADRAREGRAAILAGGRLCDEDAYALSKLARTVFRTNDVDFRPPGQAGAGLEVEAAMASGMAVTYEDVERASVIVTVGLDSREELPILHLRIRKAWRKSRARVFEVGPRRTALSAIATWVPCPPDRLAQLGEFLPWEDDSGLWAALREAGEDAVVLAGPRVAEAEVGSGGLGGAEAWAARASETGARFAFVSRRAGERGALRAGLHPELLPGGRRVADGSGRGQVETTWRSEIPGERGRDAGGILGAAARREIEVLYLVGVDPLTDFPDQELVRSALANTPFTVVQDISVGEYAEYAEAVLPAAAFLERDGHFTDWEGRGQRLRPVRPPLGLSRPDWQIFQELSEVMGADMGFGSLDVLHEEMGELLAPRELTDPTRAAGGVDQGTPEEAAGSPDERAIPQAHESAGGEDEAATEETTEPEEGQTSGPEARQAAGTAEPSSQEGLAQGEGRARAPSGEDGEAYQGDQPEAEQGDVLLFSYPLLVDEGRLSVDAEELKATLEEEPFLEVHPQDAQRLGLEDGSRARIRTEAGEAELEVRISEGIVTGAAFVPWNQPGLRASILFRDRPRAKASVESVAQPEEATA
jgi:NADH-quinone oxidoreductase subunit G